MPLSRLILVTPWFGVFAGGAERLVRGLATEFNRRGILTLVFTTCSSSPYECWWTDHYEPGTFDIEGVETHRFATDREPARYHAAIEKLSRGDELSESERGDFFRFGINSTSLIEGVKDYLTDGWEVIAAPYFHGLTHTLLEHYPQRISLVPCFHDEPQFYWKPVERLLKNSKYIFFNSAEEKELAIRQYGRVIGRRLVESAVAGVGVEIDASAEHDAAGMRARLPDSYFVYTGRKESGKNVDMLVDWFSKYVAELGAKSALVFLGGGDETLVPSGDPSIIDMGFVPEAIKHAVIRHSLGVINLSVNESFSIAMMEGWLLGVPAVVHSRCAVTTGHVRRCNGGLYPANYDEFALALNYLESNPLIARALGANGCDYVRREFTFDEVLFRYLREFNGLDSRAQPIAPAPSAARGHGA